MGGDIWDTFAQMKKLIFYVGKIGYFLLKNSKIFDKKMTFFPCFLEKSYIDTKTWLILKKID
jgi:hypothetical protein